MLETLAETANPDLSKYTDQSVVSGMPDQYAVRGETWKYIDSNGEQALYNLALDPDEQEGQDPEPSIREFFQRYSQREWTNSRERRAINEAVTSYVKRE